MNNITIELCAEDRARIDRLTAALEGRIEQTALAPTEPAEAPEKEAKVETPTETQPTEETPENDATTSDAPQEKAPAVTLEQIQQKVVQLAAGYNGTKKAQVREIVNAYAKKVSDLPADKWDEVWEKLTALEAEA